MCELEVELYDIEATIFCYNLMDELEREDLELEEEEETLQKVPEEPTKLVEGRRKLTDLEASSRKPPTPQKD